MSRKQCRPHGGAAVGLAAAAALVLMAPSALAQDQGQSDIVVTAATQEQAQEFVSSLAIVPPAADQMGRWNNAICVGVAGLPARQGQFIADRVAQRAYSVGLEPGAAGCAPNVSVVIAPDGNAMAQQMFEQDPTLFAYRYESGVSTLGQEAFTRFLNTERPVRWWHVTRTMSSDGEAISENTSGGAGGSFSGPQTIRSSGSMLRSTTRQDFSRVVIVIDGSRARSVQVAALADYVAMVALAQLDPDADTSAYPTIMNLFSSSGQAPAGLTFWDTAYLDGLYTTSRDAASVTAQEADIARRVARGRSS